MNEISISKPYITEGKSDVFGESVKLCAKIKMCNPNTNVLEERECYFEFEKKYKKYLCYERSDAFVMGLIITAMENNLNIHFAKPISERVYYSLSTYFIKMVAENNHDYPMHNIKLIGPTDNKLIANDGAVVTGCSNGVDSFYTISKHLSNEIPESYKLTHLLFSSSCCSDIIEERIKKNYINELTNVRKTAEDCGLGFIACYTNLYQFYKYPLRSFNMFFTPILGSTAFALQKLINIYLPSSGGPINNFNLNVKKSGGFDSSVFDIFTLSCMNSENLIFFSAGQECSRLEKENYIADFAPAQNNLYVCSVNSFLEKRHLKHQNCSMCPKCLRTMTLLYAINKLNNFKNVFDIDNFYKHKIKCIGKMIGLNNFSYVKEMISAAKINKVKVPLRSYLLAYLIYKPIKILRKIFKNSLFARKLYYKFKLDYKLDGFRGPTYDAYKNKIK